MKPTYIKNGRVILGDRIVDGVTIEINDGKISAVDNNSRIEKRLLREKWDSPIQREIDVFGTVPIFLRNDEIIIIDAKGCFVSPGFIDTHIHGDPTDVFSHEVKKGTTSVILGLSCDRPDKIRDKIDAAQKFRKASDFGSNLLGVRLEGPYINKIRCGAQNELFIHRPDRNELIRILSSCGDLLKIMTIAPELKNTLPLIRILRKKKIIASIGHSDATYEEAVKGIDAGISHSTHTFNGMRGIDRRQPGAAGAVLADERVVAEVIMDAVHVHPALFKLILKTKGPDKTILITDSIRAEVPRGAEKTGAVYKFRDGTITGSSISMIDALRNAVKFCHLALPEAVRLITLSPARLLGIERRKGSLGKGKDADIVVFDKNFDVKMTMIRGRIVYSYKP